MNELDKNFKCPLDPCFTERSAHPDGEFYHKDRKYGSVQVEGIEVLWDEDRDERVLSVAQALKAALFYRGLPGNLIEALQEHEGTLALWLRKGWNTFFPHSLYDEEQVKQLITKLVGEISDLIHSDYWTTQFSDERYCR